MEQADLFRLAAAIAPQIIGGRWRFNRVLSEPKPGDWASTTLTNDLQPLERLHLRESWNSKGRLTIAGAFPPKSSAPRDCSITVSPGRDPRAIGRDIAARLLPDYRTKLAVCLADRDARADAEEARAQRFHALATVCQKLERYPYDSRKHSFDTARAHGTLEEVYDGTVEIGVRVSFDNAVRLLAWLNQEQSP